MDANGQDMRYCPKCDDTTDQQFSLVEEDETSYKLLWNCLKCWKFEETVSYQKNF